RMPTTPAPAAFELADRACQDRLPRLKAAQILRQLGRARVALARLFLQTFQADCLQIAANLRVEQARRGGLGVDDLQHTVQPRGGPERRPAGEQLVEDRSERVHVRRLADLLVLTSSLLRRHVTRRSEDRVTLRLAGLVEALGETEIGDFRSAVGGEQYITR